MKVSLYIDQHIGAESFPGFPTSRRFNKTEPCVAEKVARSRRSAPTMFAHVRSNRYTFNIMIGDDAEKIALACRD